MWSTTDKNSDGPPLLDSKNLWLLGIFVLGSLLCLGYVFSLIVEKERKEQKNK